jgi:hypothetical protein
MPQRRERFPQQVLERKIEARAFWSDFRAKERASRRGMRRQKYSKLVYAPMD